MSPYVRYHDAIETIEPGEQEISDRIIAVFRHGDILVREHYGRSVRGTVPGRMDQSRASCTP